MTAAAKQAYYDAGRLLPALARRYFTHFGDARRILDVGCGTGDFGRYRPSPEIEIHGVDVDPGAVEQAQRFERAIQLDVDAVPLPYEDGSFDGVLAKDILEHVEEPGRVAREIHRVLRPGGVVVASVVMARPRAVWSDYTHVRGFTKHAARLLLADVGFAVEKTWPMGGVPLSNRLRFVDAIPYLLRVPGPYHLWASSWEIRAVKTT